MNLKIYSIVQISQNISPVLISRYLSGLKMSYQETQLHYFVSKIGKKILHFCLIKVPYHHAKFPKQLCIINF